VEVVDDDDAFFIFSGVFAVGGGYAVLDDADYAAVVEPHEPVVVGDVDHDHVGVVHGVGCVGRVPGRRVVLDVDAGQLSLLFAEDLVLICKEVPAGLEEDAVEGLVADLGCFYFDDVVAEGEGRATAVIAFVLFIVDRYINCIIPFGQII
jgi:hypothetical protein